MSEVRSLIDISNVVKKYKSAAGEFTALNGVNLRVGTGEFIAIVGKSGSGKSTLLNMLSGIDRPTSGEIHVGDQMLQTMSEGNIARWRGRNMGIVFQFFQLIPTLTVIENVMLPMDFCNTYPALKRANVAKTLLERVGVLKHANKLPSALSGGEQQRVAIARALANNPAIIMADEPTGNLDSTTANSILQLFQELVREGKTVIMVTHNLELAEHVTRIITIRDGNIVQDTMVNAQKAANRSGSV